MDFPITDLMDRDVGAERIRVYFHPEGLKCPHCDADLNKRVGFAERNGANWRRIAARCAQASTICTAVLWRRYSGSPRQFQRRWLDGLAHFLPTFRRVHKKHLSGYVAIHKLAVNHKRVSSQFVSAIVRLH